MTRPTELSIFVCGRHVDAAECSKIGCRNTGTDKCSFPLKGRKSGQTCGRLICASHGGPDPKSPTCPPHQALLQQQR